MTRKASGFIGFLFAFSSILRYKQTMPTESSSVKQSATPVHRKEFIFLMAFMMSIVALSTDMILPAFSNISHDLQLSNPNDIQLTITCLFIGMGIGILFYGPFSDSHGRKVAAYIGLIIFIIGSLISLFSSSFTFMLVGRFLQGFGAAGPRIICMAMVRDKFEGPNMARIMSLVMMVFVSVPALAPMLGQGMLFFTSWRSIFGSFVILAALCLFWCAIRQEETLSADKRHDFSFRTIWRGICESFSHKKTRGYSIAVGLTFAAFISYLNSAQQILQQQYQTGVYFVFYFGALAAFFGFAAFVNSKLVHRMAIERICLVALCILTLFSALFYPFASIFSGHPPLPFLMLYLFVIFFCSAILFANLNAMALQPMGHIAGVASSVIATTQTLLATICGTFISQQYDGTILPLVAGFFVMGAIAWVLTYYTSRR